MSTSSNSLRPTGPRSIPRALSPAPFAIPETAPLNIRKVSNSRPTTPSLSLQIPGSHTPKTRISVKIPNSNPSSTRRSGSASNDSDSPPFNGPYSRDGYINGPVPTPVGNHLDPHDQLTIRPPASNGMRNSPPKPLDDFRDLREAINLAAEEVHRPDYGEEKWSDDMLEDIDRLGEGAGGAVYKVKDKRSSRIMARKSITTREASPKQVLRELSFMSNTRHENICRFYGAYISPSSSELKILMELCEGGSLEAIGKRIKEIGGRVSEKVAGRIAEGVLQGLAYLHRRKIIHRDIKPSNILLSREGIVKLVDFGVSGELVDSMAGTFTGTSFYMAPERISGQGYTIRADVWSAGISLLELVQNKYPFPTDLGPIELMMYITQGDPPQLDDEEDVQWSETMKKFIQLSLTVDPNARPAPKEMLNHPWLVDNMKKEVKMGRWIREVWGWPKPPRKSREGGSSRPNSSRHDGTVAEPSPTADSPRMEDTRTQ